MSTQLRHNGCDTLMLGFDYELRRRGFAGNSCQILLELSTAVDPIRLERRLAELFRLHPILRARPARVLLPRWRPTAAAPRVRLHERADDLLPRLFNEPLDLRRGELTRFDLIGRTLVFTWSHALMDAKSAEYFLALVGGEKMTCPEGNQDWYAQRATRAGGWRARGRQAWRELERIERFKGALPVSLATLRPPRSGKMNYDVFALSAEETARVRAQASRLCGLLGDTNFHLAVTLMAFHRLHQRAGCASPSYVVPVPVGLRPKGTRAPLFSNQVTMLLHQFLPAQLDSLEHAIAAVKARHAEGLRADCVDAGIALAHLFRGLPLPLYMRIIKSELRGEICSLFFGDTGAVDPALESFLEAKIEGLSHVPAVTVPPGVGVVLYRFRDRLRFTVVHAEGLLSAGEASGFAADLRASLLDP
jgi:hypothetical protein